MGSEQGVRGRGGGGGLICLSEGGLEIERL
jgi:hypothetical protein